MERNQKLAVFITAALLFLLGYFLFRNEIKNALSQAFSNSIVKESKKKSKSSKKHKDSKVGKVLDSYNGVDVFYNGKVSNVIGRNVTEDGYNLGLKYQCVEFVKRYYYQKFNHKMPNSYGHAKEFFDSSLDDVVLNKDRNLIQYSNPSKKRPQKDALLVYGPTRYNSFGHVAIITNVTKNKVTCISQNLGKGNGTRRTYDLYKMENGRWKIDDQYILGWLSRK